MQIYSSSMDCTIRKWNFEEKACVACIQLEAPVVHMVMVGPDMVVAALQCRGGKGGKIGTYCLKKKVWTQLLRVSSHSCALALSPSMRYIATFERYTLHVVEIAPNEANSAKLKLAHTKRFTVRFHHDTVTASVGFIGANYGCPARIHSHHLAVPLHHRI